MTFLVWKTKRYLNLIDIQKTGREGERPVLFLSSRPNNYLVNIISSCNPWFATCTSIVDAQRKNCIMGFLGLTLPFLVVKNKPNKRRPPFHTLSGLNYFKTPPEPTTPYIAKIKTEI